MAQVAAAADDNTKALSLARERLSLVYGTSKEATPALLDAYYDAIIAEMRLGLVEDAARHANDVVTKYFPRDDWELDVANWIRYGRREANHAPRLGQGREGIGAPWLGLWGQLETGCRNRCVLAHRPASQLRGSLFCLVRHSRAGRVATVPSAFAVTVDDSIPHRPLFLCTLRIKQVPTAHVSREAPPRQCLGRARAHARMRRSHVQVCNRLLLEEKRRL